MVDADSAQSGVRDRRGAKEVNFNELASRIESGVAAFRATLPETLAEVGEIVKLEAQARLGHYQAGWPELTAETQAERAHHGYAPNDPLLRTGALRDAIAVRVAGSEVAIGVSGEMAAIAAAHEIGTAHVPPRPFLRPALQETIEATSGTIARALIVALEKR